MMTASHDPILARFRAALADVYGDRLERVVLFGSRARGDARPESDYDIAVFLARPESLGTEAGHLAAIGTDILMETGHVINALPLAAGTYAQLSPFMAEVRRYGLEL